MSVRQGFNSDKKLLGNIKIFLKRAIRDEDEKFLDNIKMFVSRSIRDGDETLLGNVMIPIG